VSEGADDSSLELVEIVTTIASAPVPAAMPRVFRPIPPAGRFAIPIAGGAKADEIVIKTPGRMLRRGDVLAEQWPQTSAAPLAPADGKIAALACAKLTNDLTVPAILFEPHEPVANIEPAPRATVDAIPNMLRWLSETGLAGGIQHLRQRGVWAQRWTTPDLLGQLRNSIDKPINTVICDVLDEAPDMLLHHELAMAFPVELVAGVLALAKMTGAAEMFAVVAAFGNSIGWDLLRAAVTGTKLKLVPLQDHYPQAHPTLLIHEITGRHLRHGKSPTEAGILVIDAAAAIAVGRCFLHNESMLTVPIGLRDRISEQTYWLDVPIGMPWLHVLSHLSIAESHLELRAGNSLREIRLSGDCVTSASDLSITVSPPERRMNPDPCIRCAWCVEGCPVHIQPAGLLEAAQQGDPFLADQYGLDACIECGICSYVCPSHLPILKGIRLLRSS
jgi:electron transport complex protein RnfC